MTLLKMACSRRKKTILYSFCLGALVYMGVQVVYLGETFTPLMMLSDAQSEASRLLKFISLYHYQCNSTIQLFNRTDWPLCTDRKYGIDIDAKGSRIAYSIGPSWDYAFERNIVYNHSYNLFIFSLEDIPRDLKEINRTHYYKTMIVANDPADFGRNSYGTNTLNSVMEAFHHRHLDLLKIDRLADRSHAYELLYYMAEDHILQSVQQLHITVHIDKLDDDYLYRWYRAFYNLFYLEGFRLYHTAASDSLCLQVTMMESCVYYTSWIRNPGPRVFVMHPPAIDGAIEFEEQRLVNHVSSAQTQCDHMGMVAIATSVQTPQRLPWEEMSYCVREELTSCLVITISAEPLTVAPVLAETQCDLISLSPASKLYTEPHVIMTLLKQRRVLRKLPSRKEMPLKEVVRLVHGLGRVDWLYMDLSSSLTPFLTPVLDTGLLQTVKQLGLDLMLSPDPADRYSLYLRRMFSELQRLEAQGFQIVHSTGFLTSQLRYMSSHNSQDHCCYRISYIKNKQVVPSK